MSEFELLCPRTNETCIYGDYCSLTKAAAPRDIFIGEPNTSAQAAESQALPELLEADRSSYCSEERIIAIDGAAAHLLLPDETGIDTMGRVKEWHDALINAIETRRDEHIPISSEHSPDAKLAVQVIELMKDRGFHAECGGIRDTETGEWTYYALVLPRQQYAELLESVNIDAEMKWRTARSHGRVDGAFKPLDRVPWDHLVGGEMAWNCKTRVLALRAAAAPYIRHSK